MALGRVDLASRGWRPLPDPKDRYAYRSLPSHLVAALIDAHPDDRDRALALAIRRAADPAPARAA